MFLFIFCSVPASFFPRNYDLQSVNSKLILLFFFLVSCLFSNVSLVSFNVINHLSCGILTFLRIKLILSVSSAIPATSVQLNIIRIQCLCQNPKCNHYIHGYYICILHFSASLVRSCHFSNLSLFFFASWHLHILFTLHAMTLLDGKFLVILFFPEELCINIFLYITETLFSPYPVELLLSNISL